MSRHQPPPDLSPAIHPLARPAFTALAALGGECWPIGAVRAVRIERRALVFAGFGWLAGDLSGIPLRIEADPGDEAIQKAAWAEVAAVAAILSRQVGRGRRLGLLRSREPRHLLRRLGVPPRAAA